MLAKLMFFVFFVTACQHLVTADTPDGTCPEVDPMNTTVHLADLDNCAGYYSCVGGYAIHQYCPQSTYWDIEKEYCEVGAITAGCGSRPTTPSALDED